MMFPVRRFAEEAREEQIIHMKELVIGFLGCGNIGGGVWRLLEDMREEIAERFDGLGIRVKRVLVRRVNAPRSCGVPREVLTDRAEDVLEDPEISLVAEFLGGEQPAADYMLRALRAGKQVVTANKMALCLHWAELNRAALESGAGLFYEASVCGAIPVIRMLNTSLQSVRVDRVMGIINGTTNYILTGMSAGGAEYADVLADAQQLGLAEPNPESDVEGMDAAFKLAILSSLAFHSAVPYAKVYREGITHVTARDIAFGAEMGYTLKLLAIAKRDGDRAEVRVHPTFLDRHHPLARVDGAFNAVYLHGDACDAITLQGRGAGDLPTASAVAADILQAAAGASGLPAGGERLCEERLTVSENWTTRYFLRLSAVDAPGVLARVADCFAQEGVSIAAMMQKGAAEDGRVQLVFITHLAEEEAVRRALPRLPEDICRVESMIRVEI